MSDDFTGPLDHFRLVASEQRRERIKIMQVIRGTYFRHTRHSEIEEYVEDLLDFLQEQRVSSQPAGEHEAYGIAVIGEPRAGKSFLLRRIFKQSPSFPGYGQEGSRCPLVTVIPQGDCTLDRFTIDALRALGTPVQDVPRQETRLAHMVRDHLRLMGAKILHIDEAHHITQPANVRQIKRIINTFKCLMIDKEWPIGVIFSGIPELTGTLQKDRQLQARLKFVRLADLTLEGDVHKIGWIVRQLTGLAKLEVTAEHADALAPRLIHAGGYQLGRSIEYVHDAIQERLKRIDRLPAADKMSGRALCPADFAKAYARNTGVQAADNPFVTDDWKSTDPFQTLDRRSDCDDSDSAPMRNASRKGK